MPLNLGDKIRNHKMATAGIVIAAAAAVHGAQHGVRTAYNAMFGKGAEAEAVEKFKAGDVTGLVQTAQGLEQSEEYQALAKAFLESGEKNAWHPFNGFQVLFTRYEKDGDPSAFGVLYRDKNGDGNPEEEMLAEGAAHVTVKRVDGTGDPLETMVGTSRPLGPQAWDTAPDAPKAPAARDYAP